jgi:segregation and condensation protein B
VKRKNNHSIIESLLFVAGESVSIEILSRAINEDNVSTELILDDLINIYRDENRGIQIIKVENSYQMCTNKENFEYIKKVYEVPKKVSLTESLLETLVIIAYKQPITRNQIEDIRGVNAIHSVNKLIEYGLVVESGRLTSPGKPLLFSTSEEFLKHFGFTSLNEIPEISENISNIEDEAFHEVENSIKF